MNKTTPRVYADCRLERTGKIWSWIIPICPYCGKRHTHGGGPIDGNPRTRMGNRGAHCLNARGKDYDLREIVSDDPRAKAAMGPDGLSMMNESGGKEARL